METVAAGDRMVSQTERRFSPEEYLALERRVESKHEFIEGQIVMMTGASESHNLIVVNVLASLHGQLRSTPCKVFPSDMRVQVDPARFYTYPDLVVVCDQAEYGDGELDTLLNPTLIIEILSPSTEAYDRGEKFRRYRAVGSLQEYVLIAQDRCSVERYVRQPGGDWLLSEFADLGSEVELRSIGCRLRLNEVYERIQLES